MTVQTNAFLTYDAIGNRENLSDVISNLSPEETPFTSAIGSTQAQGILYEWQTDALAAADSDNAVLEGDIVDGTASTPTTREKNYCQISRRDVVVSSTQETVKKAGRASEMSYQIAKRLKELKRDIEAVVIGNQGYNAGASGTARRTRSIESFLATNVDRDTGGGGANAASATDAATDSSGTRAFTETLLKGVIQSCYTEGASPSILSVGPFNKGVVSGFTGRTQARQAISEDRIQAAAHLYASDFGEIKVMPNRFQRERTALVIDPEYAEIAYLRAPQVKDLARTGDSERKYVVAEYALAIKNEKAHGMMAAIKKWWDECLGGINLYSADTGAADAYVLTPAPALTAYAAGQLFSFFAANANTGAATVNISGLGAKAIEHQGAALSGGEIASGDLVTLIYDGTAFQMLSSPSTLPSLVVAGDLTVDTDTLKVDSANDLVGVNVAAPKEAVDVNGNVTIANAADGTAGQRFNAYYSSGYKAKIAGYGANQVFHRPSGVYYMAISTASVAADAALSMQNVMSIDASGNLSVLVGDLAVSTGNVAFGGGGVTVGSPTGGNYGSGTLNAQGVYDDGILVTCYVLDAELDGTVDVAAWDARVPDRQIAARYETVDLKDERGELILDENGLSQTRKVELEPARVETRQHLPARDFANRAARDLDPEVFYQDMVARKALPAMPTREEWAAHGALSAGQTVQRLWETVEVQAVHINKLLGRIKALEGRAS